jgi:hypothetical protein
MKRYTVIFRDRHGETHKTRTRAQSKQRARNRIQRAFEGTQRHVTRVKRDNV